MSKSGYNFINYKYKYEELLECESLDRLYSELQRVFGNEFSDYEFILYASNGSANPAVPIVLTGNKKKILLYISDEEILAPYHLCKHFTAIFKWHIPSNYDRDSTLFPLPLVPNRGSKEFPIVPINERHTNVFFSGNLNGSRYPLYKRLTLLKFVPDFPARIETLSAKVLSIIIKSYFNTDLSKTFPDSYIKFTSGFAQGLDIATYSKKLFDSKIAICPKGFKSSETTRQFEAMRAGCVVISEPLPEHYYYKGSPIIILDSWKDLKKTVNSLLRNPDRLHELQQKTLDWWENVCCERATALYIRDTVKAIEYAKSPV